MIAPYESKKHGGGIASYANFLSKEITIAQKYLYSPHITRLSPYPYWKP